MKVVIFNLLTLALLTTVEVSQAAPPPPSGPASPTKIEGYCNENGGTYWPPTAEGVYGCVFPDGSTVVCGGALPGCTTIPATATLPPSKLSLGAIDLTLGVQTKTQLDQLDEKIGMLELMLEDLAILVEDECEPPIFVP